MSPFFMKSDLCTAASLPPSLSPLTKPLSQLIRVNSLFLTGSICASRMCLQYSSHKQFPWQNYSEGGEAPRGGPIWSSSLGGRHWAESFISPGIICWHLGQQHFVFPSEQKSESPLLLSLKQQENIQETSNYSSSNRGGKRKEHTYFLALK